MNDAIKLVCLRPASPPEFEVRTEPAPAPAAGDVLVRVEATSVNPIDLKRAGGYGSRLLRLKGAGRFPLVLGNDVAGVVDAVGRGVGGWRRGDRVVGLLPTGRRGGAHASQVVVDHRLLRPAIDHLPMDRQAVLPYCFTTVWLALRGAGISEEGARGMRVLVHGASGGLGQLALQVLARWGASVTGICSTPNLELCLRLGAAAAWDRTRQGLGGLPAHFDAGLNFGSWQDEEILVSRLKSGARGYATTVHPLLANFDRHGWLGGGWRSRADMRRMRALAAEKGARYGWTVFRPDQEALDALHTLLRQGAVTLPVGISVPLASHRQAFEHVASGKGGRAALLPAL